MSKLGDRTLAIWVNGGGFYHFTTYDTSSNNLNVNTNINYGNLLDNQWVYVYYGYSEVSVT